MDPVLLARIQFGLTAAFHFLYPPISIGLAWLIVYIGWRYLRTGEALYDEMTRFWVRILALVFAVGVATGIAMEFQFGTNWSTYSRFVGDIFGSPLAAEGVFAFFLESTFMGVLILGRNRVSKRVYWVSALMVAIGSTLSAFWIIVANSWQQTPTAYTIVDGRAVLTDFWAAVFNPSTLPRYGHTVVASVLSGAFFMAGISAWYLLKGRHVEFARRTLSVAVVAAAVFSLGVLGVGHFHAVQVAQTQPAKMAAFEGVFRTESGAGMVFFGIPDVGNQVIRLRIAVPKLLSFLISFDPNAMVAGLDQFPRDHWPPIEITFYSYHVMMLLGFYFIALSWLGVYLLWRKQLFGSKAYLKAMLASMLLPILALEFGWIAAEMGRQPWVVYGLLKTVDAASVVVPAGQILFTILMFVGIYSLLLALLVFLILREVKRGPASLSGAANG
ncbi:MAG: cytochrome ubiquinol oxidase subunit I [Anaerolineales bacterium]